MSSVYLGSKAVGSIVKIKIGSNYRNFIVVHQGKPSSVYDDSFNNGTILLMERVFTHRVWNETNVNNYENSSIHAYINNEFFNSLEEDIRNSIKLVKIPYTKGSGESGTLKTGANGLSTRLFLLSYYETGSTSRLSQANAEGAKLDYFISGDGNDAREKRCAYHLSYDTTTWAWWLRTPCKTNLMSALNIGATMTADVDATSYVYKEEIWGYPRGGKSYGVRPAMVLPNTMYVLEDGTVVLNVPPVISGNDGSLGNKTGAFSVSYTVTELDSGDSINVVEKMDGKQKRSYTAVSGTGYSFNITSGEFQQIVNGTHTLNIIATDNHGNSSTRTYTFTKNETQIEFTLTKPLAADSMIEQTIMNVTRQIPIEASFSVEVCNNGNDASPTWEDMTTAVLNGSKFFLTNKMKTASNWGYNFRIKVRRNTATDECFIQGIGGNFE